MRDNKGFSLLELIITIAILGVLITFGLSKTQVIFGYNAQEAYKKTMSAISAGKVQALSKSKLTSNSISVKECVNAPAGSGSHVNEMVYTVIYKDGNSIYTKTYVCGKAIVEDGEKIGGKGVVISYTLDGGTQVALGDGEANGLMLSFDRSTGGFLPSESNKYVREIHVSGGTREYVITLLPKTGKVVKMGKM